MPGNTLSPSCGSLLGHHPCRHSFSLLSRKQSQCSGQSHSVIALQLCSHKCFIMVVETKANIDMPSVVFSVFISVPFVTQVEHKMEVLTGLPWPRRNNTVFKVYAYDLFGTCLQLLRSLIAFPPPIMAQNSK